MTRFYIKPGLSITLLLISFRLSSQSPGPGMMAPRIEISSMIPLKNAPSYPEYITYPLVADFFATWCMPCRYSLPHFDSLARLYRNQACFLVISSEDSVTLRKFFQDTTASYHVAADRNAISFFNYYVQTVPRTFVINRQKKITWSGHPFNLNRAIIEEALENRITDSNEEENEKMVHPSKETRSIFELRILESDSTSTYLDVSHGVLNARANLLTLVRYLVDPVSDLRVEIRNATENPYMLVTYSSDPYDLSQARHEILEKLAFLYHFTINYEMQLRDVIEIRLSDTSRLWDKEKIFNEGTEKKTWWHYKEFEGDNLTIAEMARVYETHQGVIFLDRTGMTGEYDWKVPALELDELPGYFRQNYGLILETKKEMVLITTVGF